jgi:hypothetical protein
MAALAPLLAVAFLAAAAHAADPFAFFDWDVTYMTASPLGVPQQVGASLPISLLPHSIFFLLPTTSTASHPRQHKSNQTKSNRDLSPPKLTAPQKI